jgi:NAD(P)-dependent dehydrogenase (short-subunit alcohol dehydrogenase family)
MYSPVIMVTGCSSGIGMAIADLLYSETRYRVVITARESSLPMLYRRYETSERFWILPLDVTDPEMREAAMRNIVARWGGVDILVNNAGICYRAVVEHMSEEDEDRQMATNYFGPMALIRQVLPGMRRKGRGKVINISSVSGMLAMPTMSAYSASKAALEGASEALWYETKPLGINVTLIQPGFVRSASFQRVCTTPQVEKSVREGGAYYDYYRDISPFIARFMNLSFSTPESVAGLVLKTIKTENPPLWIAATLDATVFYHLRRLIPRRWLLPLLFYALPGSFKRGKSYSNRRASIGNLQLMWRTISQALLK